MSYKRVTHNPNNLEIANPCYLCKHKEERPIRNKQKCSIEECDYLKCYEKLAELEDKIENGILVELPCKVGTTIYQIYKDCSNCPHFKETGWEYDCWCDFDSEESKSMFEFDGDTDCVYTVEETEFTYNHIKDFGKDLFLTKAEAEQRLKELQNEIKITF